MRLLRHLYRWFTQQPEPRERHDISDERKASLTLYPPSQHVFKGRRGSS